MSLSILQRFGNLLEVPFTYSDLIWSETKNKIVGTYIVLNNRLVHLERVERYHIEVYDSEMGASMEASQIESISYYLPDSGMYKVNGRYEYLQKLAKRQWKKSFSWSYYTLSNRSSDSDVFQIFGQSPITTQQYNGRVFYNKLHIATLKSDRSYKLEIPEFQYELDKFLKGDRLVT